MLRAENITKSIENGKNKMQILKGVSLEAEAGSITAVVGKSGCGKSTLLSVLAGLDAPTGGNVFLKNQNFYQLSVKQQQAFRNEHVGIVFQNYHLIPELNCRENVQMPLVFSKKKGSVKRVDELMKTVGITKLSEQFPAQMSGGEQQRTAIARAFVNEPEFLFADEPTGALDAATGKKIIQFLTACAHRWNVVVMLVTHDMEIARACGRILYMEEGRLK